MYKDKVVKVENTWTRIIYIIYVHDTLNTETIYLHSIVLTHDTKHTAVIISRGTILFDIQVSIRGLYECTQSLYLIIITPLEREYIITVNYLTTTPKTSGRWHFVLHKLLTAITWNTSYLHMHTSIRGKEAVMCVRLELLTPCGCGIIIGF